MFEPYQTVDTRFLEAAAGSFPAAGEAKPAAKTKAGVETYLPRGTKLRNVTVADGLATVDLSLPFALGSDGASLLARLSQVVHTATGPEGAKRVRLLVEGGIPLGMFPGVSLAGPTIVESRFTTVVLPPGSTLTVDPYRNLVIRP